MKKEPWLFVWNHGKNDLKDRFDGEDYLFEAGGVTEIPTAAAKLIFGWGEDSPARALTRLGWLKANTSLEEAQKRLAHFTFHTEDPLHKPPYAPVGADKALDAVPIPASGAVSVRRPGLPPA